MQAKPTANTLGTAQILASVATLFYGTLPVFVDFIESLRLVGTLLLPRNAKRCNAV